MNHSELESFCRRWLLAWTGNQPEGLLAFYANDAYYRDPAKPSGLRGQAELRPYFQKLLAANPAWRWEVVEVLPTATGCALKWQAHIPVADQTVIEQGLDIMEIADGKITRNEVYFDRAGWLHAAQRAAGAAPAAR